MATYRIICTNQEPANKPPQHAHIVAVGVGIDRLTILKVLH